VRGAPRGGGGERGPGGAAAGAGAVTAGAYHFGSLLVCHRDAHGGGRGTLVAGSFPRQEPAAGAPHEVGLSGLPGSSALGLPPGVALAPGVRTLATARRHPVEQVTRMGPATLPGEAIVARAVPPDPALQAALRKCGRAVSAALLGDLVAQCVLPRPRFVVLTEQVIAQVERRWPVDALEDLLLGRPSLDAASPIGEFVRAYGAAETAAMCFLVLCSPHPPAAVRQAATDLLRSPQLSAVGPRAAGPGGGAAAPAAPAPAPPGDAPAGARAGARADGGPPGYWGRGLRSLGTAVGTSLGFPGEPSRPGAPPPAATAVWHPPLVVPAPGAAAPHPAYPALAAYPAHPAHPALPGPAAAGDGGYAPSPARQGLCLLVSRMLLPLWEAPLFAVKARAAGRGHRAAASRRVAFAPALPVPALRELKDRLSRLHGALSTRDATRARGLLELEQGGAARGLLGSKRRGELPPASGPAKRLRSPDGRAGGHAREAAQSAEAEGLASLQALVARAAEVLSLLLVCDRNKVMARLEDLDGATRDQLAAVSLRALVSEESGERVLRALLDLLKPEDADDDLRLLISRSCPSFFNEEMQKSLQGMKLLQEAEALADSPERRDRAGRALGMLLELAGSVNLRTAVPALMRLGMLDGCVRLTRRAADAVDPEQDAAQVGEAGEAARTRRHQVYQHLVSACVGAGAAAASQLLRSEAAMQDAWLADYAFEYFIGAGLSDALLRDAPPPRLEEFLLRAGGLNQELTRPLGALEPVQARCLALLADLYVRQGQEGRAASVLEALARRDGVPLGERRALLTQAMAAGESAGSSTQDLRLLQKVVRLQQELRERVLASDGRAALPDGAVAALDSQLLDLSQLYNDYAQPLGMWDACLRVLDLSDSAESHVDYALSLWGNLLEGCAEQGGLARARALVVEVGRELRLGGPCLALPYVVQQLFDMAGDALEDAGTAQGIADDVVRACDRGASASGSLQPFLSALGTFCDLLKESPDRRDQEAAVLAVAHLARVAGGEARTGGGRRTSTREAAALRDVCQRLRPLVAAVRSARAVEQATEALNATMSSLDRLVAQGRGAPMY